MAETLRIKGKFSKKSRVNSLKNLRREPESMNVIQDIPTVMEGSRVIDVRYLAQQLLCSGCDNVLSLLDIIEETVIGLASKWTLHCRKCYLQKTVLTSKSHTSQNANRLIYDVNLKAALGMVDAGIGPTHVNAFLSCLNIPEVHPCLLKRNERKIGPVIENVANSSCIASALQEKTLQYTETHGTTMDSKEELDDANKKGGLSTAVIESPILASYDMGWQKRGNGRSYSSLTGHGCLIGQQSKKILAFGTRNVACKACSYGNEDHGCRRNWFGSAKAMEADLAVDLLKSSTPLKEAKIKVETLIGDDDSSTVAKIRSEVGHVNKISDLNHVKKNLGNALYRLQCTYKSLTSTVIKHLQRCFGYALKQNKGLPNELRKAILNIVPHSFDIHDECGSWCGFLKSPSTYHHKGLSRRMALEGDNLFVSLTNVFDKFANNADNLAPCGSTQGNESFNSIVASKAPKSRHYGSSESNDFRVAAAVCQKNIGVSYVIDIKKKLSLSPGSNTLKYRKRLSNKRSAMALKKKSLEFKRRRLFKNLKKDKVIKFKEAREGETYRSGMGLDSGYECLTSQDAIPFEEEYEIVYFDVETTGLCDSSEIIQIGAVGNFHFSVYINPEGQIPKCVTELTGLNCINGELHFGDQKVKAYGACEALNSFLNVLKQRKKVLLVGHNVRFDARMIINAVEKWKMMSEFSDIVMGFADSYPIFKKVLPGRKSYAQEVLVNEFIGNSFSMMSHNAYSDSFNLKLLFEKLEISDAMIQNFRFTLESFLRRREYLVQKRTNLITLKKLKEKGISGYMMGRLAERGLSLGVMLEFYRNGDNEGLQGLIKCKNVTKNHVIIEKICKAIHEISCNK